MESNIFPFVLDVLINKPEQKETQKAVLKEIRAKLKEENINVRNIKTEFENALDIGENMGIFNLTNETIALPFSVKKNEKPETPSRDKSNSVRASKSTDSGVIDKERGSRGRRGSRRRGSSRRASSHSRTRSRSRRGRRSRRASRR